jgi:hypothetical protein
MHPLVAAVLLRMPGFDALDLNPQPQPPDRELAEAIEGMGRRKRHPVVGPDGVRQAEFLEGPLENGKGEFFLVVDRASQVRRYRLAKSVIVSG